MQINVTGRHLEVTDAIHAYVHEKMARLARHFDIVLDVHVILSVEKLVHKAEATVHVNGNNLHAESSDESMYAALDDLIDQVIVIGEGRPVSILLPDGQRADVRAVMPDGEMVMDPLEVRHFRRPPPWFKRPTTPAGPTTSASCWCGSVRGGTR